MAGERYTSEFKIAAVQQITQEGHSIPDVAEGSELPLKVFITGEQGTAIMRQSMKLTKLKKAS
jgi:hypothetical protein